MLYEYSAYVRSFHGLALCEKIEFEWVLDYKRLSFLGVNDELTPHSIHQMKKKTLSSIDV